MDITAEFNKAVSFLELIGIPVHFRSINSPCFLPGICIESGCIVVDKEKMKYPGDILHEAGHIAVVPESERSALNEHSISERPNKEAEEMMSIAWSYAACAHLGIHASFVFHEHGYKDSGNSIVENFDQGRFFGVSMLQWAGMTFEKKNENEPGRAAYPEMIEWLRN
jgi:hypothetical protein